MGARQPRDVQVTEGYAARNAHRYPARRALLLPAEVRLWWAGQQSVIRHRHDKRATAQPPAHGGRPQPGASEAFTHLYRMHGLEDLRRALRSPTYAVLPRSALLGHRGLRHRVRPG